MNNGKELGTALVESVTSGDSLELIKDYAEIGIDAVLEDGVLKDIPIVGSIVGLMKVGVTVSDRMLINKLRKFIGVLADLSPAEINETIWKLESEPKFEQRVGEHLLELLDRVESHQKPKMIAYVFRAYLEGEIDVTMFKLLNFAIERLPSFEIGSVRKFKNFPPPLAEKIGVDDRALQMLVNAGLAVALSAASGMAYKPTDVCEQFLRLNLDKVTD